MSYEIGKALKIKKSGRKISKAEKQLEKSKAKNKKSTDHIVISLIQKQISKKLWSFCSK